MPTWDEITRDEKFQALPEEARSNLKTQWFKENLLPVIDQKPALKEMGANKIYSWFMQQPDDTGQGYLSSMAGAAGRGFGEVVPGAIEGTGALLGSEGLREAGQNVRKKLESISPVNPIYSESFPVQAAGAVGQAGSMLATSGVGGLAGKALGGARYIAPAATGAVMGSAGLQGAASGAQEAEKYGMEGPEAYLRTLAGAGTAIGTEALPFGALAETQAARRLIGGAPKTMGFLGHVGSEAGEEAAEQALSNVATQTLAPEGVETPGVTENVLTSAALGGIGGGVFGTVNALIPSKTPNADQQAMQAEVNAVPVDNDLSSISQEESAKNQESGGELAVDPQGNVRYAPPVSAQAQPIEQPPTVEQPTPAKVAEEAGNLAAEDLATSGNEQAAVAQEGFNETYRKIQEIINEGETAPEQPVQPEQETAAVEEPVIQAEEAEIPERPEAEQAPEINEGAERNRAVLEQAAAINAGLAPAQPSKAFQGLFPRQPQTTQTNATQQNAIQEIVPEEYQSGSQSWETSEAGGGNRLLSPTSGQEEVNPENRRYTVYKLMPNGRVHRPNLEPMTHQEALTFRRKMTNPAEWGLEELPQTTTAATQTETPDLSAKEIGGSQLSVGQPVEGSIPTVTTEESVKNDNQSREIPVAERSAEQIIEALDKMAAQPGKPRDRHQAVLTEVKLLPKAKLIELSDALGTKPNAEAITAEVMSQPQATNKGLEDVYRELNEEEDEKTGRDLIEGRESRSKILDSIVKDDEQLPDEEQKPVSHGDVRSAQRMLSGQVPGSSLANVWNLQDFIAKHENDPYWKNIVNSLRSGKIEGCYINGNGMILIFPELIRLRQSDNRVARELDISPTEAAARRVLIHEGFVHYGFDGLNSSDKAWLLNWAQSNSTLKELEDIFEGYPRRQSEEGDDTKYMLRVLEERLANIIEKTGKWPDSSVDNGMWAKLKAFLQRIWNRLTGKATNEATDKDLLKVFNLLAKGGDVRNAIQNTRTNFGNDVKMSVSGPIDFAAYFRPAVNIDDRVESSGAHYSGWIAHALRQIPAYQKDGLSESERRDLADKWLVAHPEFLANSTEKEGFMTPDGFMDRKQAFVRFKELGGIPELTPGEVRDWLDTSDLQAQFHASYNKDSDANAAQFAQNAADETIDYTALRNAYNQLAQNGSTVSIRALFDKSGLSKDEFRNQVQSLFTNGQAVLMPADTFEQQQADMQEFGIFGQGDNPASFVTILPDPVSESGYNPSVAEIASASEKQMAAEIKDVVDSAKRTGWQGKYLFTEGPDSKHVAATKKLADSIKDIAKRHVDRLRDAGIPPEQIPAIATSPEFVNNATDDPSVLKGLKLILQNESIALLVQEKTKADSSDDIERQVALNNALIGYEDATNLEASEASAGLHFQKWLLQEPRYLVNRFLNNLRSQAVKNTKDAINAPGLKDDIDSLNRDAKDADQRAADDVEDVVDGVEDKSNEEYAESIMDEREKSLWSKIKDQIEEMGELARYLIEKGVEGFKASNAAKSGIRDSIRQMTVEEAKARLEQVRKDLAKNMEAFLGKEDSPKRQAKVRAVDSAQRRVSRKPRMTAEKLLTGDKKEALKKISQMLSKLRPNANTPISRLIPWKKILESRPSSQKEIRDRMLKSLMEEPLLQGISDADKTKLVDLVSEVWQGHRKKLFDAEYKRIQKSKDYSSKLRKAMAKKEVQSKLFKLISSGALTDDTFYQALAEEYGFRELTAKEQSRLLEIVDQMEKPEAKKDRAKYIALYDELQKTLASTGNISRIDVAKSLWYSGVLGSPRTMIAMSMGSVHSVFNNFMSGIQEIVKHPLNPDTWSKIQESWMSMARNLPVQLQNAARYVGTGDAIYLDKSDEPIANLLKERLKQGAGSSSFNVGERLAKEGKNPFTRGIGHYIKFMSRLILAIDAVTGQMAKVSSIPFMVKGKYDKSLVRQLLSIDFYKDNLIKSGVSPNDPRLNAMAYQQMNGQFNQFQDTLEDNANYMKGLASLAVEPKGAGGMLYKMIQGAGDVAQRGSKEYEERVNHFIKQIEADGSLYSPFVRQLLSKGGKASSALANFAAAMIMPAAGFGFVRVAGNLLNLSLSYIPVVGALRLLESQDSRQQYAHYNTIMRNQVIGFVGMMLITALIKGIEDEPDDRKRGWFFEGSWDGLTPQKKASLYAQGKRPNSFGWFDKDGKPVSLTFSELPIAGLMQMLANMSDTIRYRNEDWKEADALERITRGMVDIGTSTFNIAALSQFAEIMGTSRSSEDPFEAKMRRIPKVIGNFFAGFIPASIKDLDYWTDSRVNRYKGAESVFENVPFVRRMFGTEHLDIFGKQIERSRAPWSRVYKEGPEEPEYRMLGELANKGVWLSPANPANRLVGKGRNKREMTKEEGERYQHLVGKGYKDFVLRYGPRVARMPDEKAQKFALNMTDEIRDRAAIQATRRR